VAEAAARANIAWAITGEAARYWTAIRLSPHGGRGRDGDPAAPELALSGEPSAAVLYGCRATRRGRARERDIRVIPGLEIVAAVRPCRSPVGLVVHPLWPPAPRQPALTRHRRACRGPRAQARQSEMDGSPPHRQMPATCSAMHHGVASLQYGLISDANAALAKFFGASHPCPAGFWRAGGGQRAHPGDGVIAKAATARPGSRRWLRGLKDRPE